MPLSADLFPFTQHKNEPKLCIGQPTFFFLRFLKLLFKFTFTFSHLADTFIQSDLQLGVHKAINLEEGKHTEEVPITPSLRHCSNKYKLAREGEKIKRKMKI